MNATPKIGKGTAAQESANWSGVLSPAQRRRKSGQRGSTMLEFAMVAVITLVLMFGMIDFARALYSYHFVTTAAREAARFASVRGYLCSGSISPCSPSPAQLAPEVATFVTQITPQGIDSTQVSGNFVNPANVYTNPNGLPVCISQPNYPGCGVAITVTYNFNWLFPVSFYNLSPVNFQAGTIAMSSTSEMVISR